MEKTYFPVFADDPSEAPRPRVAWVTWGIVVSTIAVFLAQLVVYHLDREDTLGDALAFSPEAMRHHHYWTLVTYAWAHAVTMYDRPWLFWLHIVSNLVPLVCLGPALEDLLGHVRYLGLYVGGAIAAALTWNHFNTSFDPEQGIIGASGAVFAVIAGIGMAAPNEPVKVFLFFIVPIGTRMRIIAMVIVLFEVVQMLFRWMPEMAHWAHIGGAAFGVAYTWVALPRRKPDYLAR